MIDPFGLIKSLIIAAFVAFSCQFALIALRPWIETYLAGLQ